MTTTRIPALLDSGTTLTYLPADAVALMAKSLNATFSKELGYYEYACPTSGDNATSVVFDLGGFHINAPLSDFTMQTNVGTCVLAIVPQAGNATAILGDSFLRSAYVVYDLDNYEVSLAQAQVRLRQRRHRSHQVLCAGRYKGPRLQQHVGQLRLRHFRRQHLHHRRRRRACFQQHQAGPQEHQR